MCLCGVERSRELSRAYQARRLEEAARRRGRPGPLAGLGDLLGRARRAWRRRREGR